MSTPSQSALAERPKKKQLSDEQRAEQQLVARTANQQKVRTGFFPAPRFLRRFAKAR
jgi:hypothetical protein